MSTYLPAHGINSQSSKPPRRRAWWLVITVLAVLLGLGRVPAVRNALPLYPGTSYAQPRVTAADLDDDRLVLVNAWNPVRSEPAELVSAWPTVAVRETSVTLDPRALQAISELFAAAREARVGPLMVTSGYRTAEQQQQLWDNTTDKSLVQRPGHSEHHTGLAADIFPLQPDPTGRTDAWLAANAPRFGLILRYPEGKQAITGIAHEPWHFRYVGREHAKAITAQNLTLEEYLESLSS